MEENGFPLYDNCTYCSTVLPETWVSEWEAHHKHYKTISCTSCKKKNWVSLRFHGSGHDAELQKAPSLESVIRKVSEG